MDNTSNEQVGKDSAEIHTKRTDGFFVSKTALIRGSFFAALVTATYTVLATSILDSTMEVISSAFGKLRGDGQIVSLKSEIEELKLALDAEKKLHKTDVEELSDLGSSYVTLSHTSKRDCFTELRGWIVSRNYEIIRNYPEISALEINPSGTRIHLRCIGSNSSDHSYISVFASRKNNEANRDIHDELNAFFWKKFDFNEVNFPKNREWSSQGPYSAIGVMQLEMPYEQYERWLSEGVMPDKIDSTLNTSGTIKKCDEYPGGYCSYRFPRFSITIRAPLDDIELKSGFPFLSHDAFYRLSDYLESNYVLTKSQNSESGNEPVIVIDSESSEIAMNTEENVNVPVLVMISAMNYGEVESSSANMRFLFNDAKNLLGNIEGVQTDRSFELILKSW